MTARLSAEQVKQYRASGIVFPLTAFDEEGAGALLNKFEQLEQREGGRISPGTNRKPHLLVPWLSELIRSPSILDAVEDVLGPNLLCWGSQFFPKAPRDPGFISWHQDATYWGLSTADVLTVWLALTPSNVANGCMRVVPGTHLSQVEHRDTEDGANMLSRGQEISVNVREEDAVDVVLRPGEFSMHNVLLFHGSKPNSADYRRVGYAIRYIPTHVRQTVASADSATLVRGVDTYGHFEHEAAPKSEFDADAIEQHRRAVDGARRSLLLRDAKGTGVSAASGTGA